MTSNKILPQFPLQGNVGQTFKRVGEWLLRSAIGLHLVAVAFLLPPLLCAGLTAYGVWIDASWRVWAGMAAFVSMGPLVGLAIRARFTGEDVGAYPCAALGCPELVSVDGDMCVECYRFFREDAAGSVEEVRGIPVQQEAPLCEDGKDDLVLRIGEYELTLYPDDQGMVLCEKGGRVCIEHIQDEHIFRFLYELLTEYAQEGSGEREVGE